MPALKCVSILLYKCISHNMRLLHTCIYCTICANCFACAYCPMCIYCTICVHCFTFVHCFTCVHCRICVHCFTCVNIALHVYIVLHMYIVLQAYNALYAYIVQLISDVSTDVTHIIKYSSLPKELIYYKYTISLDVIMQFQSTLSN